MARRYTIQCSVPKHTDTVYIDLDGGGRQAASGRQGARTEGGWEGGSKGRRGKEGGNKRKDGWKEEGRDGGWSEGREGGSKGIVGREGTRRGTE